MESVTGLLDDTPYYSMAVDRGSIVINCLKVIILSKT